MFLISFSSKDRSHASSRLTTNKHFFKIEINLASKHIWKSLTLHSFCQTLSLFGSLSESEIIMLPILCVKLTINSFWKWILFPNYILPFRVLRIKWSSIHEREGANYETVRSKNHRVAKMLLGIDIITVTKYCWN
jgi:hypothetical protein